MGFHGRVSASVSKSVSVSDCVSVSASVSDSVATSVSVPVAVVTGSVASASVVDDVYTPSVAVPHEIRDTASRRVKRNRHISFMGYPP